MAKTLRLLVWILALLAGASAWAEDCDEPESAAESVGSAVEEAASIVRVQVDVPFLQQTERKQCLLYTMGMVLATHDEDAPTPEKLYAFALEHEYTTPALGGLMRVIDIATIARRNLPEDEYTVHHVAGNTSMDYLKAALDAGNPPLVVYFSDRFGNPASPLVDTRETHAGGSNPQTSASGETRTDPWAKSPVSAGDGPVPPVPVPKKPNRVRLTTAHAAILTGIYTDTDGIEYVTAIEPLSGERTWRADQFEASFARLGRQAVIVEKKATVVASGTTGD